MAKFTFFRVYCDNLSTREEVETLATVINLYNLAEMWGIVQMIGCEFNFFSLNQYSVIVKVRTDCLKEFSLGMKSLDEVSFFGEYENVPQMLERLKGEVEYNFFQV